MKIYMVMGGLDMYLEGLVPWKYDENSTNPLQNYHPYVLESFYYFKENRAHMIPYFGDFILDSGAFSFMQGLGNGKVDWDEYAYKYIEFINKYKIDKYIELDLDYIIGVDGARRLRNILEKETGKPSIPVWHPIRGIDEFKRMCDEYSYVALGGIVGKKWQDTEQYMPWFINEAHKRGTKIHGLGFTKFQKLAKYHFDSVDSSSWTSGSKFGVVYSFKNGKMEKYSTPKGKKAPPREINRYNYIEWAKFQQYADKYL